MINPIDRVRGTLLALPGVNESTAYGSPVFNVGKKMLARFRKDGVMVLKVSGMARDVLLATEPEAYFLEDHYRAHPLVLVRINAVEIHRLRALIEQSWKEFAPPRLIEARFGTPP